VVELLLNNESKEKLLPLSGEQTASHIADLCSCEFALVKVNI